MGTMADRANSRRPATRPPRTKTQWLFRPYWRRVRLWVGDRVSVASSPYASRYESGSLRYWGKIHCAAGYWAGIELDLPHGQNNGSLDGRRYFVCGSDRGLFVRVGRCRTHDGYGLTNGRRTPSLPRTMLTGVSSGRRRPFPAQTMRKGVDDEDNNSSVESLVRRRVGEEDDSSSAEPPPKKMLDTANADADEKVGDSNIESPKQKTVHAADDAHGKVSFNLSSKGHLSAKAGDKVALKLSTKDLLSTNDDRSSKLADEVSMNLLSAADLSSTVVLNLSLKDDPPSKADGLSIGGAPPPAVFSPDSSLPGQPVAATTTPVMSTPTGSSSDIAGSKPDISGHAPGSGLVPNIIKKTKPEEVQGYEYALAQVPFNGEGGQSWSTAEDNTNTSVVSPGSGITRDRNNDCFTGNGRKHDHHSNCATVEEHSHTRCQTSIVKRNCLSRSCDEQGEAYVPGDASIYVSDGTSIYVPGGVSMPGTVYSPALHTQATAHENAEISRSVVGTPLFGWTADKETNKNPSAVGMPSLGENLVGRALEGGGEIANVNLSESDHRSDHTSASLQLVRTAQAPPFQGPALANLEIGGNTQVLLRDNLRTDGTMQGLLSHDAFAAGSLPESLLPSENKLCPIPAPPVKGSSAWTVVVAARPISAPGEASPENRNGRDQTCRREEPFRRTSCDDRHVLVVGTHRPSCLADAADSYAPEETVGDVPRLPAGGEDGETAKVETKEWQHHHAMEGSAMPNKPSNAMVDSALSLPSMSLNEVEDSAPSMPSISNKSRSDASTSAGRCRAIVPWAPPFAAEDSGSLDTAMYGVLPRPLRNSEGKCQPMVRSSVSRSALTPTQNRRSRGEFETNNLQVAVRTPQGCKNSRNISVAGRTFPGAIYPTEDATLLPSTQPRNNQNVVYQRGGEWMSIGEADTNILDGVLSTTPLVAMRPEMTRPLQTIARQCDDGSLVRAPVLRCGAEPSCEPAAPCIVGTTDRPTPTHGFPACPLALTTGGTVYPGRARDKPLTAGVSGGSTLSPDRTLAVVSREGTQGNAEGEGFVHPPKPWRDDGGRDHALASEIAAASVKYYYETGAVEPPNQTRQLEPSRHASEKALGQTRRQESKELADSENVVKQVKEHRRGGAATASTLKSEPLPQNLTSSGADDDDVHRSRSETSSDVLSVSFDEKFAETRRQKSGDETLSTEDHGQHESETVVFFAGGGGGEYSLQTTPRASGKGVHVSVSQGETRCSSPSSTAKPSATTDKKDRGFSATDMERGISTTDNGRDTSITDSECGTGISTTSKECGISTSRLICVSPPTLLGSLQLVGGDEPVVIDMEDSIDLAQVTPATVSVKCTPTLSVMGERADPPAPPTQYLFSPALRPPRPSSPTQSALFHPLPPPPPPPPGLGQLEKDAAPTAGPHASVGSRTSSSGSMSNSCGNVYSGTDFDEDDDHVRPPRSLSYRRRRPRLEILRQLPTGEDGQRGVGLEGVGEQSFTGAQRYNESENIGQQLPAGGPRDIGREHSGQECAEQSNRRASSSITSPPLPAQSVHTASVGLVPAASPGRMANVPSKNRPVSQAGCQQQQEADPPMNCALESVNRFETRGFPEKKKCTEKKKRRFCRKRYPPPPGPPPSPSPDSPRVSPPRVRWELPVGKRAVATRDGGGSCNASREHVVNLGSHDLVDEKPVDGDGCSQESGQLRPTTGAHQTDPAAVSEAEQVEVVFLPPSTPPPPHARRRAKRSPLPTPPSPAHVITEIQPDTPTSTTRGAGSSTRETSTPGEGELLAARAPSSQRSTHRTCSSMDGVDDSGSASERLAPRKNTAAGVHTREAGSHLHEGRELVPSLSRTCAVAAPSAREDSSYTTRENNGDLLGLGYGDSQQGSEIKPAAGGGGWSSSYDGSAAKRRAHGICVRVAALEDLLDRVEKEALAGTLGMGTTSSGVDGVGDGAEHGSAGVDIDLKSAREGEEGIRDVTTAAANSVGAVSIRGVTDTAPRPKPGGGGTIQANNPCTEVAAVGGSDSTDDTFRAVSAIRDELSSHRLLSEGTTRGHQKTPDAARKPSTATETEMESRSEQQIEFHGDTAILPMALAVASQLAAPGRRALQGVTLVPSNSEYAVNKSLVQGETENAADLPLVRDGNENAVDRNLGRGDSATAVDRILRRDDSERAVDIILRRGDSERAVGRALDSDGNNSENVADSFYFNLGRSMVQDSFGSERTVDTASTANRSSFGWDAGGLLGSITGL